MKEYKNEYEKIIIGAIIVIIFEIIIAILIHFGFEVKIETSKLVSADKYSKGPSMVTEIERKELIINFNGKTIYNKDFY